MHRRTFVKQAAALFGGLTVARWPSRTGSSNEPFKISLAQYSLHRTLFAGEMEALDFPLAARRDFGVDAVEYVNIFFLDRAKDASFLGALKERCDGEGVRSLLIMCDREGKLGDPDDAARAQAVENHYKWVDAAALLGCHAIRVNAMSDPALSFEEQQRLAADGLRRLCAFADPHGLDVIVENHGGLSSNGVWLAGVMELIDHPRAGTLPDFGNFDLGGGTMYDRYQGVHELMPYARAVSAKSYDFDETGACVETDYDRMLRIVLDAGYRGYVGIEYAGDGLSEPDGIRATHALLERVRADLADAYSSS